MPKRITVKEYQEAARNAVRGVKPALKPLGPILATIEAVPLADVLPKRNEAARAAAAAETRKKHLDECYGPPHAWEFVRKGRDPVGKHTKSGYLVKTYAVILCRTHPNEGEVIAGMGEAKTYANLKVGRERPGRPPRRREDFDNHFSSGVAR